MMAKMTLKDKIRVILEWVFYIAGIFVFSWLIITYVGQRTIVDGDSMNYTLIDGDNLVVDKLSYRFREIERFDVVVFRYHNSKDTYYIKRIIGLPGETIVIYKGVIYIDGDALKESYGAEEILDGGMVEGEELTLGENEYFVMGDNRNNSKDSRDPDVGPVPKDWIVGKAFLRIMPFDKFGLIGK